MVDTAAANSEHHQTVSFYYKAVCLTMQHRRHVFFMTSDCGCCFEIIHETKADVIQS